MEKLNVFVKIRYIGFHCHAYHYITKMFDKSVFLGHN